MRRFLILSSYFFILSAWAFSQNAARDHNIIYEDYFTQAFIQSLAVSPDGKNIAYIEWRWDQQKDGRNRDLWIVNIETKATQRLTYDIGNEENPQWSPDGSAIYFIGHFKHSGEDKPPYDGSSQVWRITPDGSGLIPITRIPEGIDDYKIAQDGSAVFYSLSKDYLTDEWSALRQEYKDQLEFGHGLRQVSEMRKLDLSNWRETKLVDEKCYIHAFALSPDGKRIAMITTPDELNMTQEGWSEVDIFELKTGKVKTLPDELWRAQAPSPYGWLENLTWSKDSKLLAFSVDFDGYPQELFTARFEDSGEVKICKLIRPQGVSAVGGLKWHPAKEMLCHLGDHKARTRVYGIDLKSSASEILTPGDVVVDDYDFAGSAGSLVALQNELTYNSDLVLYAPKKKPERITNVNPQVDTWKLPQISIFKWAGANGDTVEGILELPPDYKSGRKLPLIVNLHGGPTASEKYCFLFWIYGRTALAAKGYAMFAPNYRGSTGYGDKFMTDLIGHENNIEVEDILKGVDALIAQGLADPDRLGVMGWSNGGYLTNCLLAANRFKAASSGAGIIDMAMQWGEEDTPGHVINFTQGLPWENPNLYRKASPLYALKPGITTAVLIHAGGDDPRVPPTQSRALFRALHYYIKAPCELIVYPGEEHSLSTYQHRLAKMKWDHAWLDKYLPVDK